MHREHRQGLIHLYYGDGKGKTTAALGLLVRSAGHGRKALLVQFLKNEGTGELSTLARLQTVQILSGQVVAKFLVAMDEAEKEATRQQCQQRLAEAFSRAASESFDLLVLDEALAAVETGMLQEAQLVSCLQTKPARLEVVMTGRHPSGTLLDLTDYATEMICRRHPYDRRIGAREGIEF